MLLQEIVSYKFMEQLADKRQNKLSLTAKVGKKDVLSG
jgi:hypothetical protein